MPDLGWYDQWIDVDYRAFDEDRPVSVWEALALQSNVQHIITQSPQTRVSWRASINTGTTRDGFIVDNTGAEFPRYEAMYATVFPLTWIKEDRPCGLYAVLRGVVDGTPAEMGGVTYRMRIVPAHSPPNDFSVDPIVNFSGTLLADTADSEVFAAWIKPEPSVSLARSWADLTNATEPVNGDPFYTNPRMSLVRAEIMMTAVEDTTIFGITGLLIREFFT